MKKFKHLLAAGAALAMALAFALMPSGVLATTNTGTRPGGANDPSAPINKTWTKPTPETKFPKVTATFTVSAVTANSELGVPPTSAGGTPNDYKNMPVLAGVATAIVQPTIDIAGPAENANTGTVTTGIIADNFFTAANFPNAGIYRYKIQETNVDNTGYSMSGVSYYIDVVVENDGAGGLKVADYICWNTNSLQTKVPSLDFTDDYSTTGLTVNKKITGTQANMNDKFDFQVTLHAQNAANTVYQIGDSNSNTSTDLTPNRVTGEATKTFTNIGNDGWFVIYGLQAGDTYEITEVGTAAGQGYTTTITTASKTGGTVPTPTINDAAKKINGEITANTANDGIAITYTNTRNGVIPTAFFTTYAPYLAGVAVIGGLGYAMFRRKKED